MISRPSYRMRLVRVLYALLVFAAASLVFAWATSRNRLPLLGELPDRAPWYAAVALERPSAWYDSFLPRHRAPERESPSGRLIAALDVLRFAGADSFADDVLPSLSGNLEIAELPSGDVVLAAGLSDPAPWFELLGVPASPPERIHEGGVPLGGLLEVVAPKQGSWAWVVRDGSLYVASRSAAFEELGGVSARTLREALRDLGSGGTSGVFYVRDAQSVPARNPYLGLLLSGARFPLVLDIAFSEETVVFRVPESEKIGLSSTPGSAFQNAYSTTGVEVAAYLENAGGLYGQWISGLSEGMRSRAGAAEALLRAFYGAPGAPLTEVLSGAEFVFLLFAPQEASGEPDWLLALSAGVPEDVLKGIAERLFAASHPRAVENTLADGSAMVELRADTAGLAWEEISVPYGGSGLRFFSLSGAGEIRGYARGTVPRFGQVLTSNVSLIQRVAPPEGRLGPVPPDSVCPARTPVRAGLRIAGAFLGRHFPALALAPSVAVSDSESAGVTVCLVP